ncbi:chlorophyll a-b binding protein 6A chloroplastic-like, partial [Trifolium medium]|nr:chlorophyll a-b binding protein 6A chloroplastic-like [Trifolium medium]
MACNTLMSSAISAFPSLLSSSKSRFVTSTSFSSFASCNASSSKFSMTADNWMPGQPRPPYLDGSAPG